MTIKVTPLLEVAQDIEQLSEETEGRKNYFLKGIYSQCEIKNNNGRIYPFHLVEREVRSLSEKIAKGVAFGEFGHPKNIKELPTINEEKVSHRIVEMNQDGKNFIGKSVIIPAGMGELAIKIIETGGTLSVSSRAIGKVNSKGIVESNYKMFTYDLVFNPGMPGANQTAILENREYLVEEKEFFSESEWALIEKERNSIDAILFKVDMLSALNKLKNI